MPPITQKDFDTLHHLLTGCRDNIDDVKDFLRHFDVHATDSVFDRTALKFACGQASSPKILQVFFEKVLKAGGRQLLLHQLTAVDNKGDTCLLYACGSKWYTPGAVKFVCEKIVDVGGPELLKQQLIRKNTFGASCFRMACMFNQHPLSVQLIAALVLHFGLFDEQYEKLDDDDKKRLLKAGVDNSAWFSSWSPDRAITTEMNEILKGGELRMKKAEEEAAAERRIEEEASVAKKKAEEEAAANKKKAEEEAAVRNKKAIEEAAAVKKKIREETAAIKKKIMEETEAKKRAAEEASAKKKAEEATAKKKKAEDEALLAAEKKADQERAAATQKKQDDASPPQTRKAEESIASTTAVSVSAPPPSRCFKRGVPDKSFEQATRALLGIREAPPNRPDLQQWIPDKDDAEDLLHYLKCALPELKTRPAIKKLIAENGLTDDDIMILHSYKIQDPFRVYRWLNGWLGSSRRDEFVKENVAPFFTLLYRAMEKLPREKTHANRAIKVNGIPALKTTFDNYEKICATGQILSFWGFSSFSTKDDVVNREEFVGKPQEEAIVYSCGTLEGVNMEPFAPKGLKDESEILPLCPCVLEVVTTVKMGQKLVIAVKQLNHADFAYVAPRH